MQCDVQGCQGESEKATKSVTTTDNEQCGLVLSLVDFDGKEKNAVHDWPKATMPVGRSCSGVLFRRNCVGKEGPWCRANAHKMRPNGGCETAKAE